MLIVQTNVLVKLLFRLAHAEWWYRSSIILGILLAAGAQVSSTAVAAECTGAPIFTPTQVLSFPGVLTDIVAGDFNIDGYDDLVVSTLNYRSGAVIYSLQNQCGIPYPCDNSVIMRSNTFKMDPNPSWRGRGVEVGKLALGFLDNFDSYPDMVSAESQGVGIWTGVGTWTRSPQGFQGRGGILRDPSVSASAVAITDVDMDGRVDIVAASSDNHLRVFKNLRDFGSFNDQSIILDADLGIKLSHIAVGNLFGGGASLVGTNFSETSMIFARLNTESMFLDKVFLPQTSLPWHPILADFNGDGNLDLAVSFPNDDMVKLWLGKPPGTSNLDSHFTEISPLTLSPPPPGAFPAWFPYFLAAAELTGDGKLDLVVISPKWGLFVFPGDGTGKFGTSFHHVAGERPVAVAVGRFDADVAPDLAVINEVGGKVQIFHNDCQFPPLNFNIGGLEVTQVIQDLSNSVPLIAGKRTFVRGYALSTSGSLSITGILKGFDATSGLSLGPPLYPLNLGGTITPPPLIQRGSLQDNFLFELPPDWIKSGSVKLVLEINHDERIPEIDYSDNAREVLLTFKTAPPVKIEIVTYTYKYDGYDRTPTEERINDVESEIRARLPASNFIFTRSQYHSEKEFPFAHDGAAVIVEEALGMIRDDFLQATTSSRRPGVIYLAVFSSTWIGGIAAGIPGWVAAVSAGAPDIAIHELGHSFGRYHVECTPNQSDEDGPDSRYPYPGGTIGGPDLKNPVFAGFSPGDANRGTPIWPTLGDTQVVGDIMSYCDPSWLSDYTYKAILQRLAEIFPPNDPIGDFLVVTGTLNTSTHTVALSALRLDQVAYLPELIPGDYSIRLLDGQGLILASHAFTPTDGTESQSLRGIHQIVNFIPGTRHIVIADSEGIEWGAIPVSANVPSVAISSLSPGLILPVSGSATLTWSSTDLDGDSLTADLLYSANDTETWTVIASGIKASAYTFDTATLPGTKRKPSGRLRVRVNDGVNSSYADVVGLNVANKAPRIRIHSPFKDEAFTKEQRITLTASTSDLENGSAIDSGIKWYSNIDGLLGRGPHIAPHLSEGVHKLAAVVIDQDGGEARAEIQIQVSRTARPGAASKADAGPDQTRRQGDTVSLDASKTPNPEGDPVRLFWKVLQHPAPGLGGIALDQADSWHPTFSAIYEGVYSFRLYVTNRQGTTMDDVIVTVAKSPCDPNNFILADSPIAYYRLNEAPGATTAKDLSGNANNGTFSPTGITLGVPGRGNGDTAALFNHGRMVVSNNVTLNPASITLEALLNWSGNNGFQQRVIEKSRYIGGEESQYGLSILPDGRIMVEIQIGAVGSSLISSSAINSGRLYHLAVTYDGSLMRIYLNGILDSKQAPTLPGGLPANSTNLSIGNQVDRDRPFNGIIDEIALYNKALSAEQIQAHAAGFICSR